MLGGWARGGRAQDGPRAGEAVQAAEAGGVGRQPYSRGATWPLASPSVQYQLCSALSLGCCKMKIN